MTSWFGHSSALNNLFANGGSAIEKNRSIAESSAVDRSARTGQRISRMTLRSLSLAGAFVLAATLVAHSADITGKWTAQVPGRDGQTRETLTGTTSGRNGDVAITDGTVKGDAVAFTVVNNFQGNEVKILYKGTVAGDEIKFTRQREGGDQPPAEFVAKKAK